MDHRRTLRLAVAAFCIVYECASFLMMEGRVVSPNMSLYMHRPFEGHEPSKPEEDRFMSWVRKAGETHRKKQLLLQRQSSTAEEYSGLDGVRNPQAAMTWLDWKPTVPVTPKTLIIDDQNGSGDFLTIAEAINSIPRNMYRAYRVTVQINAGVYRYYDDPSTYMKTHIPIPCSI